MRKSKKASKALSMEGKKHAGDFLLFRYLLFSFAIPFLIQILALFALHIVPFGDKTIVISDAKYAYLPQLSDLGYLLRGGEGGLLYSFKNGLGGNNLPVLAWGMINSLFLLSIFADLETLPVFYTWLTVLNLSVSGVSMAILLREIFGQKTSNLIFSTSYALIGFSVVNNFQVIFFVGVHLLPLVILGLYRLVKGRSPILYILVLP